MPTFVPADPSSDTGQRVQTVQRRDVETRNTLCVTCDISCNVVTEISKGRVVRVRSSDNPLYKDNICMKGILARRPSRTRTASCTRSSAWASAAPTSGSR